jgi:hypothetical protein
VGNYNSNVFLDRQNNLEWVLFLDPFCLASAALNQADSYSCYDVSQLDFYSGCVALSQAGLAACYQAGFARGHHSAGLAY